MSYVPRIYPEIVRDLLTTLTGGTVRETLVAPAHPDDLLVPVKLKERPVRRISHLEGVVPDPKDPGGEGLPYRFTTADFELVGSDDAPDDKSMIRFREEGQRPKAGSILTVNYYPVQTPPVPITDLNIGSVVRTMMETFSRELALAYQQLDFVYRSAFLDTAEGTSLDKVVALVGVSRTPARQPVVKLRFTRRTGVGGQITVPANTPVTDENGTRYLTQNAITMEPYENSRDILARGENAGTSLVEAGTLTRLETLIAGVGGVTNPEPAYALAAPEPDDDLRRRARNALQGNARGTLSALRFGLLAIDGVKDVAITEHPNGVAGEIQIDIAYSAEAAEVLPLVQQRVEELRPAGVRVLPIGEAARKHISVQVALTLAGEGVRGAELDALKQGAQERLAAYFKGIAPGGIARRSQLLARLMEDARIADATVMLLPVDGEPVSDLQLAQGEVLEVDGYSFPALTSELASTLNITSVAGGTIPVRLMAGVTLAEARSAIETAFVAHLAQRASDRPLTADGIIAALRDETRYVIVREELVVTVETSDGRFAQLTDGIGTYEPVDGEKLEMGTLAVEPREGN